MESFIYQTTLVDLAFYPSPPLFNNLALGSLFSFSIFFLAACVPEYSKINGHDLAFSVWTSIMEIGPMLLALSVALPQLHSPRFLVDENMLILQLFNICKLQNSPPPDSSPLAMSIYLVSTPSQSNRSSILSLCPCFDDENIPQIISCLLNFFPSNVSQTTFF